MIAVLYTATTGHIEGTYVTSEEAIAHDAERMGLSWVEYPGVYDPAVIDSLDETHIVVDGQIVPVA